MKKINTSKHDKVLSQPPTTGSRGISTSSNITVDSSGADDDINSLFPDFHENRKWSSEAGSIRDAEDK